MMFFLNSVHDPPVPSMYPERLVKEVPVRLEMNERSILSCEYIEWRLFVMTNLCKISASIVIGPMELFSRLYFLNNFLMTWVYLYRNPSICVKYGIELVMSERCDSPMVLQTRMTYCPRSSRFSFSDTRFTFT